MLCNILTTMLRPNLEDPMNTAQDLVDNNITLYVAPGAHIWKQFLEKSSNPAYNTLAQTTVIPKDWEEYWIYPEHYVIGKGTHALMTGYLHSWDLYYGEWWRSKEKLGNYPFGGYLANKKWYLNEVS